MCIVWLFKFKSSKILVCDQLGPFPQITQIVCQISAILTEKLRKPSPVEALTGTFVVKCAML